ncbi:lipid A biosynthesis acyltransferase [Thiomicrospira pelophila]|uniref:LpxL/LpxP family acyltransferase n=1 Tax=Thiomicrospira pelophila TaxID=934 RepID=UPI0004A6E0E0|nr:lipid A biosynthesis acyltransferase [Thiomicrospira pelophila]
MSQAIQFKKQFLCPRYWGIWLGVGLLRLLSFLPYQTKFSLGPALGRVMYWLSGGRRKLARQNIRLAFPNHSDTQTEQLLKDHFASLGISLMETAIVWWGDYRKHPNKGFERNLVHYEGIENLKKAQARGKGVLILAPHFTTLEMTGLFVSFLTHFNAIYRPHDNPLMDYLIAKGRSIPLADGRCAHPIANHNTRSMLKVLRKGESMVILPDQRYRARGHVKVPFFGHMTRSNPATSKIAKLTNCAVVPCLTERTTDNRYIVTFLPALENFPSDSAEQDTLRLHAIYEQAIKNNPTQYLWVHNRWDLKLNRKGEIISRKP